MMFVPYIAAAVATNRFTRVRDSYPIGSGTMTPADLAFWKERTREAMHERHRLHELFFMLYGPPEPMVWRRVKDYGHIEES